MFYQYLRDRDNLKSVSELGLLISRHLPRIYRNDLLLIQCVEQILIAGNGFAPKSQLSSYSQITGSQERLATVLKLLPANGPVLGLGCESLTHYQMVCCDALKSKRYARDNAQDSYFLKLHRKFTHAGKNIDVDVVECMQRLTGYRYANALRKPVSAEQVNAATSIKHKAVMRELVELHRLLPEQPLFNY